MEAIAGKAFDAAVLGDPGAVACLFHATWCPFCRSFYPVFRRHAASLRVRVVEVDISEADDPLWDRYHIDVVPSVLVFRGGGEVMRLDGRLGSGISESSLRRFLGELAPAPAV